MKGLKTKNPVSSPAKGLGEEIPGRQYKNSHKWIDLIRL
jgi:hypothetical protein